MAAFSSFQNNFLIDSLLLPNTNTNTSLSTINNICGLLEEPNNANNNSFSQFCQPFETSNLDHSTDVSALSNNEPSSVFSITNKTNIDSSSIITAHEFHDNNTSEHVTTMNKNKRKHNKGCFPNSAQSKDMRVVKEKKQKKRKYGEEEKKVHNEEKKSEAPTGYIHVRAKRGQATDSHSLAERVRREKISEKMKLLQALVPGCDKVTGKALMLEEIINYVQSLQHQVEFLSLKLASVNPTSYDFGMDLESFMVTPNQSLSSLPSPLLPSMQQQCTTTPVNNYSLLDNPANIFLSQNSQVPNALSQGNRQMLWEVDGQRHKMINQSGFNNNNLFHSIN